MKKLLTEEAAKYLGMSRSYLRQDRTNGVFKKIERLGLSFVVLGE